MNEERRFDDKIEKWYETKAVFLTTILVPVSAIFLFIGGIKTDIALIQQSIQNINANHEVHIQDILQEIKQMKTEQEKQQDQIIELQKQILVLIKK